MKDAKGHGSDAGQRAGAMVRTIRSMTSAHRGMTVAEAAKALATNKPAAPVHDAMEQGGVGFHGEVRPPRTSDYEPAAVPFGKDEFAGMRGRYNEHGSRHGYNPASVNAAIASSTRAGRRIGGKEASAIHRLLKGR